MSDDNPLAPVLADTVRDLCAARIEIQSLQSECEAYRALAQEALSLLNAVQSREFWIDMAQMRRVYDRDRRGDA